MKPSIARAVAAVLHNVHPDKRTLCEQELAAAVGPDCPRCDGWGHVASGGAHPEDPNPSNATDCPDCDGTGFPSLAEPRYEVCRMCRGLGEMGARLVRDELGGQAWARIPCTKCGAGECGPGVREVRA